MRYVLEGNEKELERVLREQRIRIGRGLIKITPIPGALVSEEDALKTVEAKTEELNASLAKKNEIIASLTSECDSLKARVAELESDDKKVDLEDSKNTDVADSKSLPEDDSMFVDIDNVDLSANTDEKKTTKKK